jgi:hypothetical protein
MQPEEENNEMSYDLEGIDFDPSNTDDEYKSLQDLKMLELYLDRLDRNAVKLGKSTVTEGVSQRAIRDLIKKAGYTAEIEVKPGDSNLRRMDIFGDIMPGEKYVVEVKLGFDNFISGVAQLKYYRHLLTKSDIHPYAMILAFHDSEIEKVPSDVYWFCDEEEIIACKAEEVVSHLAWQKETILHWRKEFAELEAKKNSNK